MFFTTKRFEFCASHQLDKHDGKCKNLHGHNYVLDVTIRCPTLQVSGSSSGMVEDFSYIKKIVTTHIIEVLDHRHLNDILPNIWGAGTTAEKISEWAYKTLSEHLLGLYSIRLYETPSSWVEFRHD